MILISPADSCINQLLSITHEIYHSIDKGYEIRGGFLDSSKAFDKYGTKVLFLNQRRKLEHFLRNRKQRVCFIGRCLIGKIFM